MGDNSGRLSSKVTFVHTLEFEPGTRNETKKLETTTPIFVHNFIECLDLAKNGAPQDSVSPYQCFRPFCRSERSSSSPKLSQKSRRHCGGFSSANSHRKRKTGLFQGLRFVVVVVAVVVAAAAAAVAVIAFNLRQS